MLQFVPTIIIRIGRPNGEAHANGFFFIIPIPATCNYCIYVCIAATTVGTRKLWEYGEYLWQVRGHVIHFLYIFNTYFFFSCLTTIKSRTFNKLEIFNILNFLARPLFFSKIIYSVGNFFTSWECKILVLCGIMKLRKIWKLSVSEILRQAVLLYFYPYISSAYM